MVDPTPILEEVALTRLLRLNAAVHGLVTGLIAGLGLFIATNWLILKGGEVVGPHLALLGQFFMGYRVTFVGSLIGFVYAFICGFVGSYVIARIYNWLVGFREDPRRTQPSEPSPSSGLDGKALTSTLTKEHAGHHREKTPIWQQSQRP